ncbi:hypothetical protein [Flavisolibacter tropicus]|uniref:ATP synthase subunit I n=1 Tax=Flavisolibacter tropicus TaxID=1492898 RepID=A0A172TTT4_9BACT|nr:hypothetical protein [Flavisolibacter tropicus]ANE50183.1 hypothetical protein SY85_06380 [Flavisolibacter tropicus]
MQNRRRPLFVILFLFIALNAFFISGKSMLARWGADQNVLIIGNLILFLVTIVSALIAIRSLKSTNPHAFVRGVFGSITIKLFACMIAALVYIAIYKKDLNKPALFALMGLYLLYTFLEVSSLTKLLKKNPNG